MSDAASAALDDARNRLRGWKKLVKPPRWLRRPALYVVLAAGCGVLGWEVIVAVRLLFGGTA
jgi:hypothetical protein